MSAPRRADWSARLAAYLRDVQGQGFRPGHLDCALFAAGGVEAMTGQPLAPGLRGYRTLARGQKMAQAAGYADHVDVFAQALEEIEPRRARLGDVAVVAGEPGLSVGIVQGESIYVMALDGLGLVPRSEAVRAFRV